MPALLEVVRKDQEESRRENEKCRGSEKKRVGAGRTRKEELGKDQKDEKEMETTKMDRK